MASTKKRLNDADLVAAGGNDPILRDLKRLIVTLTHTGEKLLDPSLLKGITKICKQSNSNIIHAYHLLMEQLEANHSEVRLSAFQICIELFKRSHCFRELLVANLQHVMVLTAETNSSKAMPSPRTAAISLKKLTLCTIQEWAKEYGSGYKKLHHGISYLKNCKKVDFSAMAMEERAELSRQDEMKRRKIGIQSERFKKVAEEMKELQPDVVNALAELDSCISLLLPRPEDFFVKDEPSNLSESQNDDTKTKSLPYVPNRIQQTGDTGDVSDSDSAPENDQEQSKQIFDFRKYGIINPLFSMTLRLDPDEGPLIKKTEENSAIIENAQDLYKLLHNKYQPCIFKWETIIEKCADLEVTVTSDVLKNVKDLKKRLDVVLQKYDRLNLNCDVKKKIIKSDDTDTSDSDFEEVENKEGFEVFAKSDPVKHGPETSSNSNKLSSGQADWCLVSEENDEQDPTSVFSTTSSIARQKPSSIKIVHSRSPSRASQANDERRSVSAAEDLHSQPGPSGERNRKEKLLAVAPKVPFDIDLYHWEDEKVEAPTLLTVKPDGHRFWVATAEDRDELRDPDGEASLRTRVIEFTGSFTPVKWMCRAPLPSGKLCPRKDREKCPFHGKIVGRDKTGTPTNAEDQEAEKNRIQLEKSKEVPDWQDPKLLAELKAKTGVDLQMPDRSKRGWRKRIPGQEPEKKFVGLTDIKASQNTVYNRLSRKVFKKSAMKRVAADMDKLDRKRYRDKYGDQFNYLFEH